MSRPRVRPTFVHRLPAEPRTFYESLADGLADPAGPCRGHVFGDGAILRIRGDDRPIWSPALHLRVERDGGGGGDLVHGQFSPSSPVWTAFVAIYIGLTFLGIVAACYGCAQWALDRPPWALVGVPISIVLAGLTHGAAYVGQGLGADDMYELRAFVERIADSTR